MQIIISPAKQMRINRDAFEVRGIPPFPKQTKRLHEALKSIEVDEGPEHLQRLWNVSNKLFAQCLDTLHAFAPVTACSELDDPALARLVSPALFSYHGIQYQSMAPEVMDADSLAWLQDHLWILSGLYGCARPFDAVEPYRLEMGARLVLDGHRNLYGFWGDRIAREVSERKSAFGATAPTLVNLASVEYAKAVLPHIPAGTNVITPIFGETIRNGRPVQRSTASKAARGSLVRWLADRRADDPWVMTDFDIGYRHETAFDTVRTLKSGATETVLVFLNKNAAHSS